ncbi:unnamed protein product [Arabidopsis arenosa]|uniref:Transmembrane protein n=1 Tax=Arabidopsis arenosa TaxID=38785 RepID=A0A8S2AE11_ARAAE|nr:unnamed protein product [Arabidopsis arenosa]
MVLDFGNGGGRSLLQDLLVVVSLGCGSSAADDRLWLCRVLAAGGCELLLVGFVGVAYGIVWVMVLLSVFS